MDILHKFIILTLPSTGNYFAKPRCGVSKTIAEICVRQSDTQQGFGIAWHQCSIEQCQFHFNCFPWFFMCIVNF
jgi:hypothetical protein